MNTMGRQIVDDFNSWFNAKRISLSNNSNDSDPKGGVTAQNINAEKVIGISITIYEGAGSDEMLADFNRRAADALDAPEGEVHNREQAVERIQDWVNRVSKNSRYGSDNVKETRQKLFQVIFSGFTLAFYNYFIDIKKEFNRKLFMNMMGLLSQFDLPDDFVIDNALQFSDLIKELRETQDPSFLDELFRDIGELFSFRATSAKWIPIQFHSDSKSYFMTYPLTWGIIVQHGKLRPQVSKRHYLEPANYGIDIDYLLHELGPWIIKHHPELSIANFKAMLPDGNFAEHIRTNYKNCHKTSGITRPTVLTHNRTLPESPQVYYCCEFSEVYAKNSARRDYWFVSPNGVPHQHYGPSDSAVDNFEYAFRFVFTPC